MVRKRFPQASSSICQKEGGFRQSAASSERMSKSSIRLEDTGFRHSGTSDKLYFSGNGRFNSEAEVRYQNARLMVKTTRESIEDTHEIPSFVEVMRHMDEIKNIHHDNDFYSLLEKIAELRRQNDEQYMNAVTPDDRHEIETQPELDLFKLPSGSLNGELRQRGLDGQSFVAKVSKPADLQPACLQRINAKLSEMHEGEPEDALEQIDRAIAAYERDWPGQTEIVLQRLIRDSLIRADTSLHGKEIDLEIMKLISLVMKRHRLGEHSLTARSLWHRIETRVQEIYQVADKFKDTFKLVMLTLLERVGLSEHNLILADTKDPIRTHEKAFDKYFEGRWDLGDGVLPEAWVTDVLRCSIIVHNAQQLIQFQKLLSTLDGTQVAGVKVRTVRMKNRFSRKPPTHFRFFVNNLELTGSMMGSLSIVCEVQAHLKHLLDCDRELNSHKHYTFLRAISERQTEFGLHTSSNIEVRIEQHLNEWESYQGLFKDLVRFAKVSKPRQPKKTRTFPVFSEIGSITSFREPFIDP